MNDWQREASTLSEGFAGCIKHVVVLMLENRSFDNILGRLYVKSDQYDGLDLNESNPWHKPDGSVENIRSWSSDGERAPRLPELDPGETFDDFNMQIFGLDSPAGSQSSMSGFVDNYMRQTQYGARPKPTSIMHHFLPHQVPVISTLARAFGVSDRWHASAPCETWPNRYFVHAGTAGGYVNNRRSHFPYRWPRAMPTIFRRLDARGYNWRIYFHDLPQTATMIDLWPKILTRFCLFEAEFERHAQGGRLATYSFIEPRYYPSRMRGLVPNDQHPPHDTIYGEQLIARVYNAVRQGPGWEKTLLIITYDEHGGCYDHAPPPAAVPPGGPCPDGFAFDRYGVRVPAVIVSPYVASGSVVRPEKTKDTTAVVFDHCSIQATLHKLFDLGPPLSPRVVAAPDLLCALRLEAPTNNGPEGIIAPARQPSDAEVRSYARRGTNRHQHTLLGPFFWPAHWAAHVGARIREIGVKAAGSSAL